MRLIKGDCLEVMDQLIADGIRVDAVITDPPYGTTNNKWDSIIDLKEMWIRLNKIVKDNGAVVLFGAEPYSSILRTSNLKQFKYDWVWNKKNGTGFLNAKKQPLRVIEYASVFYKKQCIYNPQMRTGFKPYVAKQGKTKTDNYGDQRDETITVSDGSRYPINLLDIAKDQSGLHPTQKPIELMEYLIKTYTNERELVLDFTMGSGTTGVACKNTNRDFIGIELDSKYFRVARKRLRK